ncbi:MAG: ABC transporter permease subunit [Curvibacter sp.]
MPEARAASPARLLTPILLGGITGLVLQLQQPALWPATDYALALAGALGLVLAFAARYGRRAQLFVVRLAALGYAVPGTVLALGIMTALAFLADASFGLIVLGGSTAALVVAYVVRFLSLSFGTLEAGFGQIAPGLDMAARSLGADKNATLRRVHLPLLRAPLRDHPALCARKFP